MSAAIVIRPQMVVLKTVQATAAGAAWSGERKGPAALRLVRACAQEECVADVAAMPFLLPTAGPMAEQAAAPAERAGIPFYRKYTEGMLRRYHTLSMESGRVPSMLGREMFRGKVTSYQVHGFDDVVIFVLDVERCVKELSLVQQHLVERIALQGYTQEDTAALLGVSLRTVIRRYNLALDELTRAFLRKKLLRPMSASGEEGGAGVRSPQ